MQTILNLFKNKESFTSIPETTTIGAFIGPIILLAILTLIYGFLYSYGAARLSYAYCLYSGNNFAAFWSVVCFFFSGFYYPYYALMLNPTLSLIPEVMKGGKRKY
jgi:hypothetical protein